MKLPILLAIVLSLASGAAAGESAPAPVPTPVTFTTPTAVRGMLVGLKTPAPSDPATPLFLWLRPVSPVPPAPPWDRAKTDKDPNKGKEPVTGMEPFGPFPVVVEPFAKAFACALPLNLPLGKYSALVAAEREYAKAKAWNATAYSGSLTVVREGASKPVVLRAIRPETSYPGQATFLLLGDNFSEVAEDHTLVMEGGDEYRLTPGEPPMDGQPQPEGAFVKYHTPHKLEVFGTTMNRLAGLSSLRLRVGEENLTEPASALVSPFKRSTPLLYGLLAIALLLALILAVLRIRNYLHPPAAGQRYSLLSRLLLDPESDSYSLSKFQLYVWSAAAVFGYVYLLVARNLIQQRSEFPGIPDTLPGLIAVSVSTSAMAAGITSLKGSKGSGEQHPSVADFITVGGVVSAERFQFFVWTILGVLAFVFLIVQENPARMETLPRVPESFLYMMGASSAGYLGGKLARRPGPIIDSLVATFGSLVVEIRGRRLSQMAQFRIDGEEITCNRPGEEPPAGTQPPIVDAKLEILKADPEDKDCATAMRLSVSHDWAKRPPKVKPALLFTMKAITANTDTSPSEFTIINPDGQKAAVQLAIKGSSLASPTAPITILPAAPHPPNAAVVPPIPPAETHP